ncbi:MAG: hypothetical protein FWD60_00495 [Candidatus Azobacteroides sp.]|nr:hypothetical protein [Candidatus Azobacteroides sp.]
MNLYRIFYKIKEFPRDVKHIYQRARKGYSYRDLWSIDYWFMEIMPKMLTDFKKNLHGCPAQFTTNDDGTQHQDIEKGMKDWEDIIERMIFYFREMNDNTCSMKNEFEDEYFKQLHKPNEGKPVKEWFIPCEEDEQHGKLYRLNEGEVDPELEENYRKKMLEIETYKDNMKNEGFELFSKYFWDLWD